jgi:tetratricopeptide (TPR) repeat protein
MPIRESSDPLVLYEQSDPKCKEYFEEAAELYRLIDDNQTAAINLLNSANAHVDIREPGGLDEAERLYYALLNLVGRDPRWTGVAECELGILEYRRYLEVREAGGDPAKAFAHLERARDLCEYSRHTMGAEPWRNLHVTHNALAQIYRELGELHLALRHQEEAIRSHEAVGDEYRAATCRYNAALILQDMDRTEDARAYAQAALDRMDELNIGASEHRQAVEDFLRGLE